MVYDVLLMVRNGGMRALNSFRLPQKSNEQIYSSLNIITKESRAQLSSFFSPPCPSSRPFCFLLYVSMNRLNARPIRPIFSKVLSIYSAYRGTLFGSGKLFGTEAGVLPEGVGKMGPWSLCHALDGE
jgi:hypothetical protein